jgi:hypothetical protein
MSDINIKHDDRIDNRFLNYSLKKIMPSKKCSYRLIIHKKRLTSSYFKGAR